MILLIMAIVFGVILYAFIGRVVFHVADYHINAYDSFEAGLIAWTWPLSLIVVGALALFDKTAPLPESITRNIADKIVGRS